jgi:hypothetical protein
MSVDIEVKSNMEIHKKPSAVQRPHPASIYEIAELDDHAKSLIGWPGYQISQNKSGSGLES